MVFFLTYFYHPGGVNSVYLSDTIKKIPLYFTPSNHSFFPPYYLIGD